jgi:hypothetical protein
MDSLAYRTKCVSDVARGSFPVVLLPVVEKLEKTGFVTSLLAENIYNRSLSKLLPVASCTASAGILSTHLLNPLSFEDPEVATVITCREIDAVMLNLFAVYVRSSSVMAAPPDLKKISSEKKSVTFKSNGTPSRFAGIIAATKSLGFVESSAEEYEVHTVFSPFVEFGLAPATMNIVSSCVIILLTYLPIPRVYNEVRLGSKLAV